jgi:hypothetical protein
MKSIQVLTSLAALSALCISVSCSSKSDSANDAGAGATGGSGGTGQTGGGQGTGGTYTGGGSGTGGGVGTGGSIGADDGGPGGAADDSGSGGAAGTGGEPTCQANLETDKNNCGHCGRVCESGDCSDGQCGPMLVLDTPNPPSSFLYRAFVNGGKVYEWEYTTTPDARFFVYSAPAPLTPLAQPSSGVIVQDVGPNPDPNFDMSAAAFDPSYVYQAAPGATTGSVARKKLDGSESTDAATMLFTLPGTDPGLPASGDLPAKPSSILIWKNLAIATNAAYLTGTTTANGTSYPYSDSSAIYAITPFPSDSSTPAAKLTGLDKLGEIITDLTVANGHLFWIDNSLDTTKRSLFTAPVAGGNPVLLEDDVLAADHASVTSDGTFVYWTIASNPGELRRCPLADLKASSATKVAEVDGPQEGLAVDEQYVYFMTIDAYKTVSRAKKDAVDQVDPLGSMAVPPAHIGDRVIGVDAKFVYLSDSDAKIWRLYKTP